MAELLTDDEKLALELLSKASGVIRRVIGNANPAIAGADWAEAAADIHHLQHTIMAQAAARAYPDRFRLLGGGPKE